MVRGYSVDDGCSQILVDEKFLRDKIIKVIQRCTKEMEGYSYFGSNPGVSEEDYEDASDEIMLEFEVKEKV